MTSGMLPVLGLVVLSVSASPPIRSAQDATLRLRAAKGAALARTVKDITAACRGRMRHSLRDQPQILAEATRVLKSSEEIERRAILDLDRCFSPARFANVLALALDDASPRVIAYAAEVSARQEEAAVLPALLARWDAAKADCLKAGLSKERIDVCVWLTYAPGAVLGSADEEAREAAAARAREMLEAPHAKVREVAVETLASARIPKHAAAIRALIAKEKKKAFPEINSAALIRRFAKRARALVASPSR